MSSDLKKRLIVNLAVIVIAFLFLLPTVFRDAFKDTKWISKPISLGLDLSGGVHLVYRVEVDEAVKSRLQSIANAIRSDLRKAKIPVTRAKANNRNQIEIVLFSERHADRAREKIEKEFKDLKFIGKGNDGGRVKFVYGISPDQERDIKKHAVEQAIETLRRRVDQFGVAEPLIQRIGNERIILQMPGVTDIESVKKIVGSVAKLEFRLLPTTPTERATAITLKDQDGNPVKVNDVALMTGDAVADARVGMGRGQVEVLLTLTSEGGRLFRKITSENVGRNLAIILDGVVYSSPT
ncbi:MAG: hypothetical protein D6719_11980, partial [Candidatus Dadabacteria bacterium]